MCASWSGVISLVAWFLLNVVYIRQGTRSGHAGHPLNMGQTSRASVRRWSTTRHKSSTGVPSSVHYQLNICFSRANSSATAALESSIPVPAQASEKPRHPAAAAAAAAAHHHHLCPYGSSLSLGRLQKRMQIAGASSGTGRGWAVSTPSYEALAARKCSVLPLLKVEPNQRVLTIPNMHQETDFSCTGGHSA
ncbi:uncharacterized protein LOC123511651 isoform X2 [Portunus trituberculatus]|uniref:uncharacterized protein LOC123511651 isoform X2 n=1 Tax=Portunus trituberculatus TaxID=210409 RepID=UPI001E1D13B9|nr:uncharacterized protein LOC123511651 isoform X2 [Portunus trituberculatus]